MTLDQLKANGNIIAHFPDVAPALDEFLTGRLVVLCANFRGGEAGATEAGQAKALADTIVQLRSIADPAAAPEMKPLKKLHRFSSDKPPGAPTSTTPK